MSEKASPEQTPLLTLNQTYRQRRSRTSTIAVLAVLSTIVLGAHLTTHVFESGATQEGALSLEIHKTDKSWKWHDVQPSTELHWEACYGGEFECARLDVPMDWQSPSHDQRVVLGVIKLPAKSKDNPVPPLFTNPGGPGGSGVAALQSLGKSLQTVVGDNHDIISWDPRGVGVSTPRMDCWGSFQKRQIWQMQDTGVVDERPGLIHDAYVRALAYSDACERSMEDTAILPHLSTAYSARDMLEILHKTGHEKLRYWGYSYGTILGGVYATLYPDTIERFVSDGNVDYTDFFEGDHANFFQDTDSILDAFDDTCHRAGPVKCAFWANNPTAIQERRASLLEKLKDSPVVLPAWAAKTGPEMPLVITYSDVQILLRTMLYKPIKNVERLAQVYAGLERGDGLPFYDATSAYKSGDPMSEQLCAVADVPATEPQETPHEEDAYSAIMCSDGAAVNGTVKDFEEYVEKLKSVSRWAGVASLYFRLPCAGRTVRPKWRVVPQVDAQIETGYPVLFINNLHDNVTPISSARNNSAHFPGSVLLTQKSYGHCTFAAPSTCTARVAHTYFQNGTLPEPGTQCEQDYDFFEDPSEHSAVAQDDLTRAMWDMAEKVEFGLGDMASLR